MKTQFSLKISLFIISFIFSSNFSIAQQGYVSKINDLEFGDVFIGYAKEILHTDINAAKFRFYHTNSKTRNIFISFTLPGYLTNGTEQLVIEFNQNHCSWSYNDHIAGRTNLNPSSRSKISRLPGDTPIYIWLGGNIASTTGFSPGVYSAQIIMTIDY